MRIKENELVKGKYYWIKYKEGDSEIIGRCEESWGKLVFYISGQSAPVPLDRVEVIKEVEN